MPSSIDRRCFLAAGAATAAGFYAAPARALQTDSPLAGRIQKAVKYRMIDEELSVQDKFKLLKDLGFDGVEPHVRDTMSVDKREFLKASELTGVRIHGVANSASPDIRAAVDLARFLGADSVLIVAGRVQKDQPYDVVYRETQTLLREALPYAAQHRIALLVENVWNNFLLSPLEMARYLDELDHESAAAYFDVGNVVRLGWPEHWIRILRQRIAKLDIKEYSRAKQESEGPWKGFDVELGEGDCDWPAVREALLEIDYTGWATAEVKGGDRKRLQDISVRMDRVLGLS